MDRISRMASLWQTKKSPLPSSSTIGVIERDSRDKGGSAVFELSASLIDDGSAALLIYFLDRKSTRLNSSHMSISYAVCCWKKKSCTRRSCRAGKGGLDAGTSSVMPSRSSGALVHVGPAGATPAPGGPVGRALVCCLTHSLS